uniref:COX assembly mitochondrial protein n=1 Tax=Strongyloides venezuelensis TaxID=75913 RepID=A0A0K0F2S6_STRVS
MQTDLSSHLHTEECNVLINMLQKCNEEFRFGRFLGKCTMLDEWVWKCTKQERIYRRNMNPKYAKIEVEMRRLPIEYWTPILHQLKAEGKLNIDESNGCKL